MKRAKKRGLPILSRLTSGARRADRALTSALAFVRASDRRLVRQRNVSSTELKALIDEGRD